MKRVIAGLMVLLMEPHAWAAADGLQAEILQARQRIPEVFARVEALRAKFIANPPPYERRGEVARAMKALGQEGLMPLLALITNEEALRQVPPPTREIVLTSAIEAVGVLRDARTAAVMQAILDGQEANPAIARAAAESLGRLADDRSLSYLVARAVAKNPRERAAIAGLAYARRPLAVSALAARLEERPESGTAEKIADAMGFLGSSWAWTALGPAQAEQGLALRLKLSNALCAAYPAYPGPTREAIGRALLMIDHPSLPDRLAELSRNADRALAVDLQSLRQGWLRTH